MFGADVLHGVLAFPVLLFPGSLLGCRLHLMLLICRYHLDQLGVGGVRTRYLRGPTYLLLTRIGGKMDGELRVSGFRK